MDFSVFVWGSSSLFFLLSGLWAIILKMIDISNKTKIRYIYIIGLGLLISVSSFYLPHSLQLWVSSNEIVDPFIRKYSGTLSLLFIEVWYTIVFFRDIWFAILMALLTIGLESSYYPYSGRYRMMKRFNHNKLFIMVLSLIGYVFMQKLQWNGIFDILLLNMTVFTACYYWKFGFSIILYILKKSNIPYELGIGLLLFSYIGVGEYFLLPLIACIGIGISDIWMDFYKRDAASMVFSLDFS